MELKAYSSCLGQKELGMCLGSELVNIEIN